MRDILNAGYKKSGKAMVIGPKGALLEIPFSARKSYRKRPRTMRPWSLGLSPSSVRRRHVLSTVFCSAPRSDCSTP